MKINKTLAAGLAATLAVSSLASVSSAVVQHWTWDMEKTYGKVIYKATALDTDKIYDLGKEYLYEKTAANDTTTSGTTITKDVDAVPFAIRRPDALTPIANQDLGKLDTADHKNGVECYDYFMVFEADWNNGTIKDAIGGLNIVIEGKALASDGATTEKHVQKVSLINVPDGNKKSKYWILPIYTDAAPRTNGSYAFLPEKFVQVDSVSLSVAADGEERYKDELSKRLYKDITAKDKASVLDSDTVDDDDEDVGIAYGGNEQDGYNIPVVTDDGVVYVKLTLQEKLYMVADYFTANAKNAPIKADGTIRTNITGIKVSAENDDITGADVTIDTGAFANDANVTVTGVYDPATGTYKAPTAANFNDQNGLTAADLADQGEEITLGVAAYQIDISRAALAGKNQKGEKLLKKIIEICKYNNGDALKVVWQKKETSTYDEAAWLPKTENDNSKILERDDIWMLSDTNDYLSESLKDKVANASEDVSDTQTYEVTDEKGNEGTIPKGFNGMASKFADFFNSAYGEAPKKEAKVIFKFKAKAADNTEDGWKNGGIPSTEVGLRNFLDALDEKDFALFVNYKATTGSLQAAATLKPESGEVEFDVSNILTALKGSTIGVVQDIYYGLETGFAQTEGKYKDAIGLYVTEVRFEYNDDDTSSTDAKTDEKTDAKGDEKPADDKKTDEKPADEKPADEKEINVDGNEKETEIPSDSKTDDKNNGNAVVDTGSKEVDPNPHTGVALAVIPAIVAGAAVVVSKKRK